MQLHHLFFLFMVFVLLTGCTQYQDYANIFKGDYTKAKETPPQTELNKTEIKVPKTDGDAPPPLPDEVPPEPPTEMPTPEEEMPPAPPQ